MSAPLHGIKILDFTRLLPGPFGTMVLGDLGADVVRVEAPNFPDLLRMMPPMDGDVSAAHREMNRNKRSILLDLKNPEGARVVKRLVKNFDVVMEQFRPGVMERLGAGYEALAAENPRLIYCSITGYGQDGPYRDRAGHDINYLALSGVMSYLGRKDSGPLPLGIQVADQCAGGLNAVVAVLAALISRERTGQGQYLDISMTDGAVHLGCLELMNCLSAGRQATRESTVLNGGSYYDFYETADGGHMSVGSLEPQFFKALCQALGRDDLISFHMAMGERGNKLKDELGKEFKKRTRQEWEEIFAKTDACVEPVLSIQEAAEHPVTRARNMVVEVERGDGTLQRQTGSPYKFSRTACEYRFAGVSPGRHTALVLKEAGFTEAEIQDLKSKSVVK
ncbi:MAG TPA: CaiB/BaiF CoA-transferase family protein [bacterium]|nr:CaiB/BaiF CoA-transferase family protein [bacterium]